MLQSTLGTAVTIGINDNVAYTFVFSGKALDRVTLNYVITKNKANMNTELIEDFEKLDDLYSCYISQLLNIAAQSAANEYKPIEWRIQE